MPYFTETIIILGFANDNMVDDTTQIVYNIITDARQVVIKTTKRVKGNIFNNIPYRVCDCRNGYADCDYPD